MISLVPYLPEWIRGAIAIVWSVLVFMALFHVFAINRKPQSRLLKWVLICVGWFAFVSVIFATLAGRPLVEIWPEGASRIASLVALIPIR